ncbi:SprT family zinc-dependent metalloprotease [Saccharibacillus sp. CPCC 101409]|uniref:M48 family metallopeptidase n=1 Tax=Saccharibacillus sp. CPCC 101409 TaxID=3058041 RepID=UPI0026741C43|nr:SprT family zinc-dependent metalloprotease [Saccharibacillus sp. CPCC 101409]MDO3408141.1 SprT family zinc-dependent metalloprotease [Saccharibacillus sp. CPCC 101409]
MNITHNEQLIEFHIEYAKRKKIYIRIEDNGLVTVKAPNGMPEEEIQAAVAQQAERIMEVRSRLDKAREAPKAKEYREGGEGDFLHLGRRCALDQLIPIEGRSEEQLRADLKKFYFSSCKKIVNERIGAYAKQLKAEPKSIEIVESATKWGSCDSRKRLNFNYLLAMAPVYAIDYVIVHELCHIHHMNHDRSFWRKLGSILPDYKEREEYLNRYGRFMVM